MVLLYIGLTLQLALAFTELTGALLCIVNKEAYLQSYSYTTIALLL